MKLLDTNLDAGPYIVFQQILGNILICYSHFKKNICTGSFLQIYKEYIYLKLLKFVVILHVRAAFNWGISSYIVAEFESKIRES